MDMGNLDALLLNFGLGAASFLFLMVFAAAMEGVKTAGRLRDNFRAWFLGVVMGAAVAIVGSAILFVIGHATRTSRHSEVVFAISLFWMALMPPLAAFLAARGFAVDRDA